MRHAVIMLLAAAGHVAWAQATDPGKLRDRLTGDAKGSAAANAQCQLFSPAEIATCLGAKVGAGKNANEAATVAFLQEALKRRKK